MLPIKRKKRSIVWDIPLYEFKELVKNSNTFTKILNVIGLQAKGGNINTLKRRFIEENIDFSHITLGINSNKGRKFGPYKKIDEFFIKGKKINGNLIKNRLFSENILKNQCNKCGILDIWQEEPITLQIDHINGDNEDNRIENLQILCPNCHSQTINFAGRSLRRDVNYCICGKSVSSYIKYCSRKCYGISLVGIPKKRKIERPSYEILIKEIKETSYCAVGRKYGVSDNTIRKWIKFYKNNDNDDGR